MKTLAILVGGGPAPGINAVIAAATIEARNHGLRVLGCLDGLKWLVQGNTSHVHELEIGEVSRIHFEGGSILRASREGPANTPESLRNVIEAFHRLEVSYLLSIGGDGTATAVARIAEAARGSFAVAHVPKTIDNDLPLPQEVVTFGYTTACNLGKDLIRNLMEDAATTERWFFVSVMGRQTGHLALGIGGAAGATLTVIGEEFAEPKISAQVLADILEGAIIKRRAHGRNHGVALLSEGLAEKLDPVALGAVEWDSFGRMRLSELELARLLKERVTASLQARGIDISVVSKHLGYELRCASPGGYDIHYCRSLGYWATHLLMEGGTDAMITIQGGRLVAVPLREMLDPDTGQMRVRFVDTRSDAYQTLFAYMIRLKPEDFEGPEQLRLLSRAGKLGEVEFVTRFGYLVGRG